MSVAPRLWSTDPGEYRRHVKAALGGMDPLDVLADTPARIEQIVADNAAKRLRARPFADKWSPLEIMGHLLDAEWTYGFRMRLVLSVDKPIFPEMKQDEWVTAQDYQAREPREIQSAFAVLRAENLRLWRSLTGDRLQRMGVHDKRGAEPLFVILNHLAMHDLHHLDQLKRYLV